jgi:hypothetical protein
LRYFVVFFFGMLLKIFWLSAPREKLSIKFILLSVITSLPAKYSNYVVLINSCRIVLFWKFVVDFSAKILKVFVLFCFVFNHIKWLANISRLIWIEIIDRVFSFITIIINDIQLLIYKFIIVQIKAINFRDPNPHGYILFSCQCTWSIKKKLNPKIKTPKIRIKFNYIIKQNKCIYAKWPLTTIKVEW